MLWKNEPCIGFWKEFFFFFSQILYLEGNLTNYKFLNRKIFPPYYTPTFGCYIPATYNTSWYTPHWPSTAGTPDSPPLSRTPCTPPPGSVDSPAIYIHGTLEHSAPRWLRFGTEPSSLHTGLQNSACRRRTESDSLTQHRDSARRQ